MKKSGCLFLLLAIMLTGCGFKHRKYDFFREHILYDEVINPYFVIMGHPEHIIDFEGEQQKITSYNIVMDYSTRTQEGVTGVGSMIYAMDYTGNVEMLLDNSSRPVDKPGMNKIADNKNVAGGGFKEIYGKIFYNYGGVSEEYVFSETILKQIDDKISYYDYKDVWDNGNLILEVSHVENAGAYLFNFSLSFHTETVIHLDLQSWLVISYEGIIPFFGIYGYCGKANLEYNLLPVENGYNISSLYVRADYWSGTIKHTVLYRYDIHSGDV